MKNHTACGLLLVQFVHCTAQCLSHTLTHKHTHTHTNMAGPRMIRFTTKVGVFTMWGTKKNSRKLKTSCALSTAKQRHLPVHLPGYRLLNLNPHSPTCAVVVPFAGRIFFSVAGEEMTNFPPSGGGKTTQQTVIEFHPSSAFVRLRTDSGIASPPSIGTGVLGGETVGESYPLDRSMVVHSLASVSVFLDLLLHKSSNTSK